MFGRFSRSHRNSLPAKPATFRPILETLETRDCPSNIVMSITSYAAGRMVTLTGQVTSTPSPGGLTVDFSGAASGTATTDSSGAFSATLTATALSNIFAQTADGQSNMAAVQLTDSTPTLMGFLATPEDNDVWVFTGQVNLSANQGATVQFSGAVQDMNGQTAKVTNGNFDFCIQLTNQSTDNGMVQVQATDWWGLTSNTMEVMVDLS